MSRLWHPRRVFNPASCSGHGRVWMCSLQLCKKKKHDCGIRPLFLLDRMFLPKLLPRRHVTVIVVISVSRMDCCFFSLFRGRRPVISIVASGLQGVQVICHTVGYLWFVLLLVIVVASALHWYTLLYFLWPQALSFLWPPAALLLSAPCLISCGLRRVF